MLVLVVLLYQFIVFFSGKRMLSEPLDGSSAGTAGTVSDSGWSYSAIFRGYLEELFVKYLSGGTAEPVLPPLDGQKVQRLCKVGIMDKEPEHYHFCSSSLHFTCTSTTRCSSVWLIPEGIQQ